MGAGVGGVGGSFPLSWDVSAPTSPAVSGPPCKWGAAQGICSVWLCSLQAVEEGAPQHKKFSWGQPPHGWPPAPATAQEQRFPTFSHSPFCFPLHCRALNKLWFGQGSVGPSTPTCAVVVVAIPPNLGQGRQASLAPSNHSVLGCKATRFRS